MQETYDMPMSSEQYVQNTLAEGFELVQSGLTSDEVAASLGGSIKELHGDGVEVVSLIGGAASGKSTFARSIVNDLANNGLSADVIGTDDFNKGDRTWRWEHFEGKEDVDPRGKYDFDLLNEKIRAIKQNTDPSAVVPVPTYNQATGLAIDEGEENYQHKVGKVDVLIVEGDFHPVEEPDLVVYLNVPDDQRLQNRVNRDVVHRGGDPQKTTDSFNFRHRVQHLPHTLPTIQQADIVVDVDASNDEWRFSIYRSKQELDKTQPLTIERALPEDAQAVSDLLRRTWMATYPNAEAGITEEDIRLRTEGENGERIPKNIENWRKRIEADDGSGAVFVARSEGRVVGLAAPGFIDGKRHVGALYVLPETQGTGVGSQLMQKILDWHKSDENDIYLRVASYNQNAIDFYKRFGFEQTDNPVVDEGNVYGNTQIPEIEMMRKAGS